MDITIKIIPNESGQPIGKLADAELLFTAGPLAGLKLIGFNIWQSGSRPRTVTFPARQYSVNGERRSFMLLRPVADYDATETIRHSILQAYSVYEASGLETTNA